MTCSNWVQRENEKQNLLSNPEIDLVLIADIPSKRAGLAIECMEAGKDVMLDKPGCTSLKQLKEIEKTVNNTKRIFSIDFSERFEVPCVQAAYDLIQKGEIGKVVQTIGMGPHRLNLPTRPNWFFDYEKYGGILCDIASHQIDQFLFFTGSSIFAKCCTVQTFVNNLFYHRFFHKYSSSTAHYWQSF